MQDAEYLHHRTRGIGFHETITNVFAVIPSSCGVASCSLAYFFILSVYDADYSLAILMFFRLEQMSCMQELFTGCNVFPLSAILVKRRCELSN